MDDGARWDERFSTVSSLYGREPNALVAELAAALPPGRALDLACGEGRNAVWLAQRGHQVTGVDNSAVALERAAALAVEAGVAVQFVKADLAGFFPDPGAWDLVVLSYLQVPGPLRALVHRNAAAALAPGGRIVLVAHHRDNLEHGSGGPQSPEVLYDEAMLMDDFAGLDLERCGTVTRVVCPGAEDESTAIDIACVAVRRD